MKENSIIADTSGRLPMASVKALCEARLQYALVPSSEGGLGLSVLEYCELIRTIGAACPYIAYILAMHSQQVDFVFRHGSPAVKEMTLDFLSEGKLVMSATTEVQRERRDHGVTFPGLTRVESALAETGGGYRVVRRAPLVSGAAFAGAFLVSMRAAPDAPESDIRLVFVRSELAEVSPDPIELVGLHGSDSRTIQIDGLVDQEMIVGAGNFRRLLPLRFGPLGHVGWAAGWVGQTQSVALTTVGGSGRELIRRAGHSDLTLERIGRVRMLIEFSWAMCLQLAEELDASRASPNQELHRSVMSNSLKVGASEFLSEAVGHLMDIQGARASMIRPSTLERAWRDLRAATLNVKNDLLLEAIAELQLLE